MAKGKSNHFLCLFTQVQNVEGPAEEMTRGDPLDVPGRRAARDSVAVSLRSPERWCRRGSYKPFKSCPREEPHASLQRSFQPTGHFITIPALVYLGGAGF